jgi:hypothetical protein
VCNNDLAPKQGEADYDPSFKFSYIYKCLIHNINEFTQLGNLDLCGDETACGHGGDDEAGSGILARRMNKPGITFGMQTVLLMFIGTGQECTLTSTKSGGILKKNGQNKALVKFAESWSSLVVW